MELLDLLKERYSCRSFSDKLVEDEKIEKILEAGRVAPTGRNLQPQKFIVLKSKEAFEKMKEYTIYGWNAPVIIIVCYDKDECWKRSQDGKIGGEIDASIVATQMMLEIFNLGLASTFIGSFDPVKLKEVNNLPDNIEPVLMLPIGYPSEDAQPANMHFDRKNIEEMIIAKY